MIFYIVKGPPVPYASYRVITLAACLSLFRFVSAPAPIQRRRSPWNLLEQNNKTVQKTLFTLSRDSPPPS